MIITKEWLFHNRTESGAWTRAQIESLGIKWPPREGWIKSIVGKEITNSAATEFERGKFIKTNNAKNRAAKKRNLPLF